MVVGKREERRGQVRDPPPRDLARQPPERGDRGEPEDQRRQPHRPWVVAEGVDRQPGLQVVQVMVVHRVRAHHLAPGQAQMRLEGDDLVVPERPVQPDQAERQRAEEDRAEHQPVLRVRRPVGSGRPGPRGQRSRVPDHAFPCAPRPRDSRPAPPVSRPPPPTSRSRCRR